MKINPFATNHPLNSSHNKSTVDRKVYRNKYFTIYRSDISLDQIYLVASVKGKQIDPIEVGREIYIKIAEIIKHTETQILQEKVFGSIHYQKEIFKVRTDVFNDNGIYEEIPITFIEGNPLWGEGFAGLQICTFKPSQPQDRIWTVYQDDIPCGRGVNRNGTTFLSLQNMHGLNEDISNGISPSEQVDRMIDRIDRILRKYGSSYRDVVCTRIYISDILDWYSEFNKARNAKYAEYGILPENSEGLITEQIYLPSSTGIQANNPTGADVVMNVLAVIKGSDTQLKILHDNGIKQRSAYRYGSAFSRSTIICEPNNKYILLSGTAAIDEQGKSLFPGNPREQIRKTFEIADALVGKEEASLNDISLATVFLKRREDLSIYEEVANEYGLTNMPAVFVIADICREELLFEFDAIVTVWNSN